MSLQDFIEIIIMPPASPLFLIFIGALISRKWLSRFFIILGVVAIYTLSTPFIGYQLMKKVDVYPIVSLDKAREAQAIVILTAGIEYADEFKGFVSDNNGLARARYGFFLKRHTNLPILITGGSPRGEETSEAQVMSFLLKQLRVNVKWLEDKAENTFQSAKNTKKILEKHNINKILLVSNASHLSRSVGQFKKAGFDVIPAPTLKITETKGIYAYLPSVKGLSYSKEALHELLGIVWYKIKGFI